MEAQQSFINEIVVMYPRERYKRIVFSAYAVVCYVVSLIGAEGFLLDLNGLRKYWNKERTDHIIIPLLGKVKGEHFDSAHLIPCVLMTSSGINVKNTIERLIEF